MSEQVQIAHGNLTAEISSEGAWLQTLSLAGQPILFPKQLIKAPDGSTKTRGGCHVCLPNFGPGGKSGLQQHGFGREDEWEVVDRESKTTAVFENRQTTGAYTGLLSRLTYTLSKAGLTLDLSLRNTSDNELRVAPGFHPYFMVGESDSVSIDGRLQDLTQLSTAIELDDKPTLLNIGDRSLSVHSENLSRWILWTDQLGQYVCLEPTFASFSFEHTADSIEMLEPGQRVNYALSIAAS